jgi:hypothetical protein
MSVVCLPDGPASPVADMAKFIQTPSLIAILHGDLTYRQVFMDGRTLETDPNPDWMGYSVGRWDGDTLVVESTGFNDRTWLDVAGHPHTEALRTTERYRRLDFGRMELQYTLADPKVYSKPWTVKIDMFLAPDTEMLEYVCNENEKDREHMVGKSSDDEKRAVVLAPEILAKYAGNYKLGSQTVAIVLEHGQLQITFAGVTLPLFPLTETSFSSPQLGPVDFVKGADGTVTQVNMPFVSDAPAARAK